MNSINPQCPHCGLRQHPSHQASCSKRDEAESTDPTAGERIGPINAERELAHVLHDAYCSDDPCDGVARVMDIYAAAAVLAAGFGPVRAVEAERDEWLDASEAQRDRAESAEAALAGLRAVLDEYFDFGADPWEDHDAACPAPEDIWRLHRDLRASTPDREEER